MIDINISAIIETGFIVGGSFSIFSFIIGYGIYAMLSTFKHIIRK